jgi:hypothetical protein
MKPTKLAATAGVFLSLAAAAPVVALAKHGSDDPATHIRGGKGADDRATHVRRARGADDGAAHVRGGHGADDPAGDTRHGGDDGPEHR